MPVASCGNGEHAERGGRTFREGDYACSVCGRTDLPDFDSVEILEWGEGGTAAHFLGERDPLMLEFVCPDCAAGEGNADPS